MIYKYFFIGLEKRYIFILLESKFYLELDVYLGLL